MKLTRPNAFYAAALGAIVGLAYVAGKSWWGGEAGAVLTASELLAAAALGALGGILAYAIRRR